MTDESPQQFVAGSKAYVEQMLAIAQIAFVGAEQLAALHLNLGRSLIEDGATTCSALLAAKNSEEYLEANKTLAQPMIDKLMAHGQSVFKIGSQAQAELGSVLDAQYTDLQGKFSDALDKISQSGAPGSDGAIAAVKAAIAAGNVAYRGINKATKQVAETTEANLTATMNAVTANNKAASKMRKSAAG